MSESNPLVSIVMPNYNKGIYLEETLKSVFAQTYTNWELIFINDNSTDKSISIVSQYCKTYNINLITLKEHIGEPSILRNLAIDYAKGEYIAFLDSDDIWHQYKLEKQIELMAKYGVDFSSTYRFEFKKRSSIDKYSGKFAGKDYSVKKIDYQKLLACNLISTSSVVAKKKLFKEIKFKEGRARDYQCWLDIHETEIPYSILIQRHFLFYRICPPSNISGSHLKRLYSLYSMFSRYVDSRGSKLGLKKYYYIFTNVCFYLFRKVTDTL